jgi:hypothetical protein
LTELGKRSRFDLTDPLTRNAQFTPNLLKRVSLTVAQAKTQLQDQLFARGQDRLQDALDFIFEGLGGGKFFGGSGFGICEYVT